MSKPENGGGSDRARPNSQSGAQARSVALIGPYGSGKSTLFEALMQTAGAPIRRSDPRTRRAGTEMRLGHCSYLGDSWSILDCPGSVEFAHATACAIAVVDLAVVVCDPQPARALTVAPFLRALDAARVPHIVFVNRIDTLDGAVRDTLAALQEYSAAPLVLRQVPTRTGGAVTGYVDLVSARAYRYRRGMPSELLSQPAEMRGREEEARAALLEVLADHDDALLEKILDDIAPGTDEIYAQLRRDLAEDRVVEVLLGAAEADHGVRRLWKALRHDTPSAGETASRLGIAPEGAALAQVFRTQHAAGGKLSLARIWRGEMKDGAAFGAARVGGVFRMPAGEAVKSGSAVAGELVGLGRLDSVATGATLGGDALPFPAPPEPVYALAIVAEARGDDVKLSGALQKLIEEDPSLRVTQEAELGQTVLHGQGEVHLAAAVERLASGFNLRLTTSAPRIGYRETIRRPVHQHSRLKRQTGGHGQFADVKIDIAPRARGEGFQFVDRVVGGAIPRNYIPAIGEAAEEAARKGPLGHPVVDIAVTLVDGTFHSVDSSDMAFRTATRMAMDEGLAAADPVLLEPIDHVRVHVPNSFTAKAQRLLSGRRGQILGYGEMPDRPGWDDVEALVPAAEMGDLIIELRSMTMGLGSFHRRFDHLAEPRGRAERGAA
ncbi:MAG: elongation factor G [Rhodospirillales bacterium]|nr:elongation factor G [Rhodospirillales bacterium]MDE2199753.1 elongation factor G [Rhodospirillales bacterium]MDE2574628.1 elongation factor G [Rhodospirillales bacterium]